MKKIIIFIVSIILVASIALVGAYFYCINYHGESEKVIINVKEGQTYSTLSSLLKEKDLIKSELAYKIYIKFKKPTNLEHGDYILNKHNNVSELIETLEKGSVNLQETKMVTFVEGKNMRYIINKITSEFSITESEILDKLKDTKYLDGLIDKYWFLTDDIKNSKIYYSLEGYLFPDTYEFYVNTSVEDIFRTMLNNMENKLEKYKEEVTSSKHTIHEMITLSSIIELEASSSDDRKGVAGVFYNRLKDGWSLGSDVTTYYAERIDNWSRDLKMSELKSCNSYNTRSSCMNGKLPVGPICNPGIKSIEAAIEPTDHNYYYFVADKYGKTYFSKTDGEHTSTVSRLKREGLWINYES
ncbi:MAG: endolytic transglycosylase MltG [Bacilli bacterium]|nr:endolytic transglycosylase MltG [Bacilli bacterium]